MSHKFEQEKELIINAVASRIMQNVDGKSVPLCVEFVKQFFMTASYDDLLIWGVDDLYGAAIHFWNFIETREPNENKIRIYNPDNENHGWQTTHSVVEIICTDRAFLVDTLRIVINRMNLTMHLAVHMGGICLVRNDKGVIT